MRHPFDLNSEELEALELDFEEQLTDEEAERVGGGLSIALTKALGEDGGGIPICPLPYPRPCLPPDPLPCPNSGPKPEPKPIKPPIFTTLALGEEGGCSEPPIIICTYPPIALPCD
jgi:hypothetical protein